MSSDPPKARPDSSPNTIEGVLRVDAHRDEVIWKLEIMSRRGRLPGFRRTLDGCAVAAHGNPFDKILYLRAADHAGKGSVFNPELKLERKMPVFTAILFLAMIWPGVLLTDSFMRMHLSFYENWTTTHGLQTWWWYIPLTVIGVVWAWFAAIAKSNRTAAKSARETLAKIAAELDATIDPG